MKATEVSAGKGALKWLLEQVRPVRNWIGLSVGLGATGGLLLVAQAWVLSDLADRVISPGRSLDRLGPYVAGLCGIILVRSILAWARQAAGFKAGARVRRKVRLAILSHLFELGPLRSAGTPAGAAASTAMEQVEALQAFYALYLPQLFLAAMIPVAILAFVFPISWAAGAILLTTAPLIPFFMVLVGMGAQSISQRHFQALSRLSAHFLDLLQGLATLKLFNRSRAEAGTIATVSRQYRRRTMAVLRIAFLSSAVLEFFGAMAIALLAVYLGLSYLGYFQFGSYGRPLTFQSGFFILLVAPEFYLPLRELGAHYHARAEAAGAAEEILRILGLGAGDVPPGRIGLKRGEEFSIRFENVSLEFDQGQRQALKDVSFQLAAGQKVALIGPSGAGKSSLIHLLLGFVQPSSGKIWIDGELASDVNLEHWRRHLAWIGQQPTLFYGSIYDNIRLARPQAKREQVRHAARLAGVLEFSRHLPRGLDTPLGEQGIGLSRGQAQRVAMARAFLKDAPILLLDEPTAGLDQDTEKRLMQGLLDLAQGRTLLLVTHRRSALDAMDRIICLDRGRITAQGTYGEMLGAARLRAGANFETTGGAG
jgi:ATP-binding cassette subfamily C protein CydD